MNKVDDMLAQLAEGPSRGVTSYKGYIINGIRFHKKGAEKTTQNNSVYLEAHDSGQLNDKEEYFDVIKDIIMLDYRTFKVPLFWCDWANIRMGVKKSEFYTLVNFNIGQAQSIRDPFVLASQVKKAFYARVNESSNWYIALKDSNRGCFGLESNEEN